MIVSLGQDPGVQSSRWRYQRHQKTSFLQSLHAARVYVLTSGMIADPGVQS